MGQTDRRTGRRTHRIAHIAISGHQSCIWINRCLLKLALHDADTDSDSYIHPYVRYEDPPGEVRVGVGVRVRVGCVECQLKPMTLLLRHRWMIFMSCYDYGVNIIAYSRFR